MASGIKMSGDPWADKQNKENSIQESLNFNLSVLKKNNSKIQGIIKKQTELYLA